MRTVRTGREGEVECGLEPMCPKEALMTDTDTRSTATGTGTGRTVTLETSTYRYAWLRLDELDGRR